MSFSFRSREAGEESAVALAFGLLSISKVFLRANSASSCLRGGFRFWFSITHLPNYPITHSQKFLRVPSRPPPVPSAVLRVLSLALVLILLFYPKGFLRVTPCLRASVVDSAFGFQLPNYQIIQLPTLKNSFGFPRVLRPCPPASLRVPGLALGFDFAFLSKRVPPCNSVSPCLRGGFRSWLSITHLPNYPLPKTPALS
jgi:hypothetical protein